MTKDRKRIDFFNVVLYIYIYIIQGEKSCFQYLELYFFPFFLGLNEEVFIVFVHELSPTEIFRVEQY